MPTSCVDYPEPITKAAKLNNPGKSIMFETIFSLTEMVKLGSSALMATSASQLIEEDERKWVVFTATVGMLPGGLGGKVDNESKSHTIKGWIFTRAPDDPHGNVLCN